MRNITQSFCSVIPPHILRHAAEHGDDDAREHIASTLIHTSLLADRRERTFMDETRPVAAKPQKRRNVYDARHRRTLPGKLVMSESNRGNSADPEVFEAFTGSGLTWDFYAVIFGRNSIDNRGLRIDSTVHYGQKFDNALWDGRQMIYGDGDRKLFNRFTAALDVIAHELTHGVTQYTAALGYHGQTGALNEHISDAFGIMVKQHTLDLIAAQSDWLIGAGLLAPGVNGKALRSMANPGQAYDDPVIGRDPQPAHMRDYRDMPGDNGGVHINSGIPNHAFYLAAVAIGGRTWDVTGRIWYTVLTSGLAANAQFQDFADATVHVAGELYGAGGPVQRIVAEAWAAVGLPMSAATAKRLGVRARHTRRARPRKPLMRRIKTH